MGIKPLKCKNCDNMIEYNNHYHCYECKCGSTYNGVGQELAPRELWQDEYDTDY